MTPQSPILTDGEYISSSSTLTAENFKEMLCSVKHSAPTGQRIKIFAGPKTKRRLGYLYNPAWYKLRKIKQIRKKLKKH